MCLLLPLGRLDASIVKSLLCLGGYIEQTYPEVFAAINGRRKNQKSLFRNIDMSEAKGEEPDIHDVLGIKITINNFNLDTILDNPYNSSVYASAMKYKTLQDTLQSFTKRYQVILSQKRSDLPQDETARQLHELAHDTYHFIVQAIKQQKDQVCYDIGKHFLDDITSNQELLNQLGLTEPVRKRGFKSKNYIAEHATFKTDYLPDTYLELQTLSKENERDSRDGASAHYLMPTKKIVPELTAISASDKGAKQKLQEAMSWVPNYFVYQSRGSVHALTPSENFLTFYINSPGHEYINDYLNLLKQYESERDIG